jgi:hypothetical protein
MPYVLLIERPLRGGPHPANGQFVLDFDAEALGGRGKVTITRNPLEAKRFPTEEDAATYWEQPARCVDGAQGGLRRPLTAFVSSIAEIDPVH